MLKVKSFDELTTAELYEILKARAQIFVVEQHCAYQDIDDIDRRSLHIFYEQGGVVTAYLRAFYRDETTVQIGRVLTREHGKGLGKRLMESGIAAVRERMTADRIFMEAQEYAIGFYEKFGFRVTSDVFLEDDIPHVKMELKLPRTVIG